MKDKSVTKKKRDLSIQYSFFSCILWYLIILFIFSKIEYWFGGIYKEKKILN